MSRNPSSTLDGAAVRRPEPGPVPAGSVLADYLHAQAGQLLRGLQPPAGEGKPAEPLPAARRIHAVLGTYAPLLDQSWSAQLSSELSWLEELLGREQAYATRRERLLAALQRLAADAAGAPRAAALLDRRLSLARARAHTAALRALGSPRLHALTDAVTLLISEVPLMPGPAARPAAQVLPPLAERERLRLAEAVAELPEDQGEPWSRARVLLRQTRYAQEVRATAVPDELLAASRILDCHHHALGAAEDAEDAARTPRITPSTAYALGVLYEDQRHAAARARQEFGRQWLAP